TLQLWPNGPHRNAYKFSIRGNTRSQSLLFSLCVRTASRTAEDCVISALHGFVGLKHVFGMLTVAASPTNTLGFHTRPPCPAPFVDAPLVIADCAWSLHRRGSSVGGSRYPNDIVLVFRLIVYCHVRCQECRLSLTITPVPTPQRCPNPRRSTPA